MFADLHLHTKHSDGKLCVRDTINIARERNIELLSITDHDTINGVKEAIEVSHRFNMTCISGLELSCRNDNVYIDFPQDISIHILAYNLDYEKKKLQNYLTSYHFQRKKILLKLIADLTESGFDVKYDDITVIAGTQMRIQDVVNHINSSFCSKPQKHKLIEIANSYYTKLFEIDCSLNNAIEIIKDAGGIPVLAHAFFSYKDYEVIKNSEKEVLELINYLCELGIEGLEVFYSKYSKAQTEYLLEIARKNNLMITAGSDFHGSPLRKEMMNYEINQLGDTIKRLYTVNRYK